MTARGSQASWQLNIFLGDKYEPRSLTRTMAYDTGINAHVLARSCDALEELEVIVCFDASLFDSLAENVEWCQIAGVRRVED